MSSQTPRVLLVEDVGSLAATYMAYLARERVEVAHVENGQAALDAVAKAPPDVLILDVNLPDMSGLDVLRQMRASGCPTEVVVITSNGSISLAVEAMREGAFDFIVKPFAADRLRVTLRNAIDRSRLATTLDKLQEQVGRERFCDFIGQSAAMQSVYQILQSVAPSKATVFITGESGSGKEVCAAALHRLSKRAHGPFVAINCAAVPRDLLESEIFGHVKGSFTGATTDRQGAALRANGGTLFLDEIGEMDLAFQAKILRFIETGQVSRVGADMPVPSDVRIVCATNRDPRAEVASGRFREDLFYRLHVIPMELPPLRDREADALLLARHFLDVFAREDGKVFDGFSPEAEEALINYGWPGNVRELKNVIRKTVVLNSGGRIELASLPPEILRSTSGLTRPRRDVGAAQMSAGAQGKGENDEIVPLETMIDRTIDDAIARCGGSIPRAAGALKVSPSTLYRRLGARTARTQQAI